MTGTVNIRFTAAAKRELLAALKRYRDDAGVTTAERFNDSVQHAAMRLRQMPELGSPAPAELRTWPLQRFQYTLVYRVDPKEIVVIAVAHQRRAPAYWQGR